MNFWSRQKPAIKSEIFGSQLYQCRSDEAVGRTIVYKCLYVLRQSIQKDEEGAAGIKHADHVSTTQVSSSLGW